MNNRHHQANPVSTEAYREATKQQLWLVHQRKKCACGKTVTAKELRRFGSCEKCWEKK